jgi:tetratricopeptide (TPR) repeat protein
MRVRLVNHLCFNLLAFGLLLSGAPLQAQTALGNAQAAAPQTEPAQSPGAQTAPADNPDRKKALELRSQGKMVEAMPLFEILCAEYPKDAAMWEGWAVSTIGYSQTLTDAESRKKARVQARTYLVKANELGDKSPLVQILLPMIPEDGGELSYSPRKEVSDLIQQAEADFGRGDYDKAREGYVHALLLDPKNYDAALFAGDVYFKQHINGSAGEWFAKAIEIDPNRETAYRYWGDALAAMGKNSEAREKYIQAIVADPYNNRGWVGLNQWAQRNKVKLNWVKLQDKSAVSAQAGGSMNITLDPTSLGKGDLSGPAWLAYGGERALWHGDKFKKEFPNETTYRRTMREEADCLHLMVTVMTEQKDFATKEKDLDPSLIALVKIDQAGFIEPFALLNRADKDIAQDYAPYRIAHRDTLYRYFDEFVVPKAPVKLGE